MAPFQMLLCEIRILLGEDPDFCGVSDYAVPAQSEAERAERLKLKISTSLSDFVTSQIICLKAPGYGHMTDYNELMFLQGRGCELPKARARLQPDAWLWLSSRSSWTLEPNQTSQAFMWLLLAIRPDSNLMCQELKTKH